MGAHKQKRGAYRVQLQALTTAEVKRLRVLHRDHGVSIRNLAERFGVSMNRVCQALRDEDADRDTRA